MCFLCAFTQSVELVKVSRDGYRQNSSTDVKQYTLSVELLPWDR